MQQERELRYWIENNFNVVGTLHRHAFEGYPAITYALGGTDLTAVIDQFKLDLKESIRGDVLVRTFPEITYEEDTKRFIVRARICSARYNKLSLPICCKPEGTR